MPHLPSTFCRATTAPLPSTFCRAVAASPPRPDLRPPSGPRRPWILPTPPASLLHSGTQRPVRRAREWIRSPPTLALLRRPRCSLNALPSLP
ncbi:hypothetical protein VPH35_007270 [Triticum aestivum]